MTFPSIFELSLLDGSNGFVINGIEQNDSVVGERTGLSVDVAGDINGDGILDLIIGAPQANRTSPVSWAGQSYIVFGKREGFGASFNLSALNGNNGFALTGVGTDSAGFSVSGAGDINSDGIDDLLIGASIANADGSSSSPRTSGRSYIVFGRRGNFAANSNLSALNGSNGFTINGLAARDLLGRSVSRAGDINGDGIDDLIVGAPSSTGIYGSISIEDSAGSSYVIFGTSNGFPANLDLRTLGGRNGFTISGINLGDRLGRTVSNAGDINGDGIDDLVVAAPEADSNGLRSGQIYVIFGRQADFAATFNLSELNGNNGFVIDGISTDSNFDLSVNPAGDVNGDGIGDLIIGSSNTPSGSMTGQSYIVFGRRSGFTTNLSLSTLDGSDGFIINGINPNDSAGYAVSSAGDINNDGIDDLLIGAPGANSNGIRSGQSYVVYGTRQGFRGTFNLSTLDGSNGFVLNGAIANSGVGASVSSGDANGDGISDLVIGAPIGSPSGRVYVIFGVASLPGLTLTSPLVDAADVTLGSMIVNLTTGALSIAANPRAAQRSVVGFVNVNGTIFDDTIDGNGTINVLSGNAGNDTIRGAGGNDEIRGGLGNDTLSGGSGNDTVQGGFGDDLNLFDADFNLGSDVLTDGFGVNTADFSETTTQAIALDLNSITTQTINPNLTLRLGSETAIANAIGGSQNDMLTGNAMDNLLIGNDGNDTLRGSVGRDTLRGGNGDDTMSGGRGSDQITGGTGTDQLTGGLGFDEFRFDTGTSFDLATMGIDTITDFTLGQDAIALSRNTFISLGSALSFATVQNELEAQNSAAQITYIRSTGTLYYNANGSNTGFGSGGQFAKLTRGLALTITEFRVVD